MEGNNLVPYKCGNYLNSGNQSFFGKVICFWFKIWDESCCKKVKVLSGTWYLAVVETGFCAPFESVTSPNHPMASSRSFLQFFLRDVPDYLA